MGVVKQTVRWIEIGEKAILTLLGVSATLIMFSNAVGRYIFRRSFSWAEESIRILFVWSMFIAITRSFVHNEHIGFQNLADTNPKTRFIADLIYYLTLMLIGGSLAIYGGRFNNMVGHVPLAGTSLPTSVLMLPGVISGGFWFLIGAYRLITRLIGLGKKDKE